MASGCGYRPLSPLPRPLHPAASHLGALAGHHHRAAAADPVPCGAARRDREIALGSAFHADQDGAAAGRGDGFHGEDAVAAAEELGHGRVPSDSLFRIMGKLSPRTQRESCRPPRLKAHGRLGGYVGPSGPSAVPCPPAAIPERVATLARQRSAVKTFFRTKGFWAYPTSGRQTTSFSPRYAATTGFATSRTPSAFNTFMMVSNSGCPSAPKAR